MNFQKFLRTLSLQNISGRLFLSFVSITLKENKKIVENQNEVANILNCQHLPPSSLQLLESNNIDPQSEKMSCPTLKSIRHPSITSVKDACKGSSFYFSTVEKKSKTSANRKILLMGVSLCIQYECGKIRKNSVF